MWMFGGPVSPEMAIRKQLNSAYPVQTMRHNLGEIARTKIMGSLRVIEASFVIGTAALAIGYWWLQLPCD